MKFILLLLSFISVQLFAQNQSAANRSEWNALSGISSAYRSSGKVNPESLQRFPVHKLSGGFYVSVFGKLNTTPDWQYAASQNVRKGSVTGQVATCKVPLELFSSFDFSRIFSYVELPAKATQHLDRAVKDTRADSVQLGIGLPEGFTGKDVLIGITDWGFDYTHPTFYDTLLQNSRIHAAWDQFKLDGQTPQNYSYGVEYDTPQELLDAGSDTANIYSYHYHGTHVGGITGGSGAGGPYRGFGFESQFLFATFLVDAASVIDAFNWMKEKADAEQKRLVINMSWGLTYMGTLDGNSLLSEAIHELSQQGVVFVGSAGNNGDVNYHIKKVFDNDSFQTQIVFYSYTNISNNWGQSVTMWGEENKPFSAAIRVYNSANTLLSETPVYNTASQQPYLDSILVIGNDTIEFNLASENSNPLNNRPNMRLRVAYESLAYKVVLYSAAPEGTVHYWNVTELTTGVGNWGITFSPYGANPVISDAKYSIGEPACSPDVIAVAAYSSSYINTLGNPAGGTLASFSSCGPLYTEVMKPDIAAPGSSVASSISSFTDQGPSTISGANVDFNGTTYKFGKLSGTSMSSPCVAGIVSLMLDASPTISPAQVKSILKTTARTDNNTGPITAPGNTRWGMGKVNAYAAVLSALGTVSTDENFLAEEMIVYPNPAQDKLYILLPGNQTTDRITIVSMTGSTVKKDISEGFADLRDIAPGYYFAEAVSNGRIFRTPVIVR